MEAFIARKRRKAMSEINVVPYIDVMLVLLIIFMVTAPLITQGVDVDLPQADAQPLPEDSRQPLVASVDREGNYYLNLGDNQDQPMSAVDVATLVAAHLRMDPETPVVVRGDGNVAYAQVVQLMVLLQRAGAPKVGLMTQPPE
ncbi:protein TolR [Aliidiomarina haloalkalitolerans]|uniref:Tol-Pal system protein TolR n=1 Tax=Aliidiomarina haloalkalitolerans TaxID=859059 RepID=A0A432VPI4_9GAMM|nr:protein TolR [Aliidiomarina haloalkalitolerans]RUO18042.1 protein TolR [Aliidiomarina haloalkalitolerans]